MNPSAERGASDPLAERLAATIRHAGPISIAHYMSEALANPAHGYYVTRDPFGADGDFTTAPETSQMFGELVGLWCADLWRQMGRPDPVHLVELGPGRGTLMADALRATRTLPGFHGALRLSLVEISPALRRRQRRSLAGARPGSGPHWPRDLAEVPPGPMILIANELLDALPIHQYQRAVTGWHERLVDVSPDGSAFRLVLAPRPVENPGAVPAAFDGTPIGGVVERCPAAEALVARIAERVGASGGAALLIDCGSAESGPRDTLQGVRGHERHPVFAAPGRADLCAHVDFARVVAVASAGGGRVWGPIGQGEWLRALGIVQRAERLKEGASAAQRADIDGALERLVDPARMGVLFKAVAIAGEGLAPAGFGAGPW